MKPERVKYGSLFPIILAAIAVWLTSFSSRFPESTFPEADIVPAYHSINAFHSAFCSPEFISEADPVVVPMKRAGRLFLIDAKIDNEAGTLVFDTGAKGLVLNSTYFRNYLKSGGISSHGITGAVGRVDQISVGKIEIADLVFKNLTADMANLGHIENRRGVKILGLIGFNLLRDLEIVIDPGNSELMLFRTDKSGNRLNSSFPEFKPEYSQKIAGNSGVLFLKGTIGGKTLNFCFDTGAETNAISSNSNRNILSTLTITRRTTLKGAGSVVSEVLFGRMNDFTIGDRQIRNMETIITNLDALSEAYGTRIDGMLGYSFLEHGIVCVNFVNSQVGICFTKGEEK
jgi:predicted aspartyl protease